LKKHTFALQSKMLPVQTSSPPLEKSPTTMAAEGP